MALSAREAFKVGFLARCAAEGLSAPETARRVKDAADKLAGVLDAAGTLGKGLLEAGTGYGVPLALVAPPAVGGVAGWAAARMTDVDDTDVAEVKDREVLDEYRRQTERLRRQRAVRDYQRARTRTGRVFV
jgi:hypothetical protein